MMKVGLTLIYFKGCPNADRARVVLAQAGVKYAEVCQDDLESADPLNRYSSPTLLRGTHIIFGAETESSVGSCSLDIPTLDELNRRLLASV